MADKQAKTITINDQGYTEEQLSDQQKIIMRMQAESSFDRR